MPRLRLHYCLTCDRIVHLFPGNVEWHFGDFTMLDEENYGPAQCYGPFADSTPPESPLNWNEFIVDPSDEELAVMDANAESLWYDLELGR